MREEMGQASASRETRHQGTALTSLLREVSPFALIGLLGALALLFVFSKLAEEVFSNEVAGLDNSTSLWVHGFSSPLLDTVFSGLSTYAGVVEVAAASLAGFVMLLWRKHPYEAWRLALVMVGGLILNQVLKFLFRRSRPELWPGSRFAGFSFPSGHAMLSFCLFGMMIWLGWRYLGSQVARITVTLFCGLLILLVGLSRIYLGAHFLSDIVAGYLAAAFWLVAVLSGTDIYRRLRSQKQGAQPARGG